jgi:hypothetical protein
MVGFVGEIVLLLAWCAELDTASWAKNFAGWLHSGRVLCGFWDVVLDLELCRKDWVFAIGIGRSQGLLDIDIWLRICFLGRPAFV